MTKAKKLLLSLCLFFLVICLSFNTFATTTGKTTLELVENTVCTINVDDMTKFEKKITKFSIAKILLPTKLFIPNCSSKYAPNPAIIIKNVTSIKILIIKLIIFLKLKYLFSFLFFINISNKSL